MKLAFPRLLNTAWQYSCKRAAKQFEYAIRNPRETQEAILREMLVQNAGTRFGRQYRFDQINQPVHYREQVPLQSYDSLSAMIEDAGKGEQSVLTEEVVTRLLPSSGSSAGCKLIPHTKSFHSQFNRAVSPWVFNLFSERPGAKSGRAFWSISPKFEQVRNSKYVVPVGFDSDSAYLSGWTQWLAERLFAMPSSVSQITDMGQFRYHQLLHLLACEDLSLISIWHPSYLTLLLDELPGNIENLLKDLEKYNQKRVSFIERVGIESLEKLWPNLTLISCWGDAHAAGPMRELKALFPNTKV